MHDLGKDTERAADEELVAVALKARGRAYVPYSRFRMGAAVRTDTGEIVTGAVVENVSLGLAMCAERVALFSTVAAGQTPTTLVLASPRTDGKITHPCGACLQVALELGGPAMSITSVASDDEEFSTSVLEDLLPRGPHKSSD